jgi:hypothetical protein
VGCACWPAGGAGMPPLGVACRSLTQRREDFVGPQILLATQVIGEERAAADSEILRGYNSRISSTHIAEWVYWKQESLLWKQRSIKNNL